MRKPTGRRFIFEDKEHTPAEHKELWRKRVRAALEMLQEAINVPPSTKYTIYIFNKGDRPIEKVGATLAWDKELEETGPFNPDVARVPGLNQVAWPRGEGFKTIEPNRFEKLELYLKARTEGRHCVKATATSDAGLKSRTATRIRR